MNFAKWIPTRPLMITLRMTTSYFAAAAIMSRVVGRDLLAPEAMAARKRALLDFLRSRFDAARSQGPMNSRKTFAIIGARVSHRAGVLLFSTPRGKEIPLTGIVDGNEVIVSPQITGRIIDLTVDEGSRSEKRRSDRGTGSQRNLKRASRPRKRTWRACRRR